MMISGQPSAADYPGRPLWIIVPSASGGAPDIAARQVANELSLQLGQQVVVDNRPGVNGMISLDILVRAPVDGYTIGHYGTTMVVLREVYPGMACDPVKSVQMVAQLVAGRQMLLTAPSLPFKSVQDVIEHAKANPGKLTYAAGSSHLSGELFKCMTGTQIPHVPHKTTQQIMADITGARVQLTFR